MIKRRNAEDVPITSGEVKSKDDEACVQGSMRHAIASPHQSKRIGYTDDQINRYAYNCLADCREDIVRVEPKEQFKMFWDMRVVEKGLVELFFHLLRVVSFVGLNREVLPDEFEGGD